ncbi:MAG: LLM class F420-dependent oxidoreductase [Chloroflexi bacterium HGW-Chloroflexi-2]|jgi:F420-dependent oxidoreductase-like protein|nr:MAG: LLM class F420-dependent oxidoreductase [Chloroflexi bacterium HGW-Chloroflexi-2]
MKISIMIEGQNGLNWTNWKNIVDIVENDGFYGLYLSDHFTNANPPDKDSLELWTSLTYLATTTKRIRFGSLVSPISFRNPVFTARMAAAVDDLSTGRLKLGLGSGWQEREHQNYGFELLGIKERFLRFEEGLFIISQLLRSNDPITINGKFYQLKDAILLPRPNRKEGPEILIGGNGEKYSFPLIVKYAKEWNAIFLTPEKFKEKTTLLDQLLVAKSKMPGEIRRSLMTNLTYGQNQERLKKKLNGRDPKDMTQRGIIVGSSGQVTERLHEYQQTGLDEIMLQWIDLEDMDSLIHFSETVLPKFHNA